MSIDKQLGASKEDSDNLESIKGLGFKSAEAIYEYGISRFVELARVDPETLSDVLGAAGVAVSPKTIINQDWIGQAKTLAQQANPELTSSAEDEVKSIQKEETILNHPNWRQQAGFSLFFDYVTDDNDANLWQTRVYHDESGAEKVFSGIEVSQWAEWIVEQANLPIAEDVESQVKTAVQKLTTNELPPQSKNGGSPMDSITLKRGNHKVEFKKMPDRFAVRMKFGKAASETALESSLGDKAADINYVNSDDLESLDVFTIDQSEQLEQVMEELRKTSDSDVVSHVYAIDGQPGGEVIPTGTLTIQFEAEVDKSKREEILAEFGLEVVEDLDFLDDGYTVRLTDASTENPLKIVNKLQKRKEIKAVEADLSVQPAFEHVPVDTLYPLQWHLDNKGDRLGLVAGADVKAEEAWEFTRGEKCVLAIIDDGIDLDHPDFDAPDKIVAPRDFGQGDFNPEPVSFEDNHGTACAGVALAEENGLGIVGLAPKCRLMPIRMAGLSDNSVVNYFRHAMENGADIISCSWSAKPWYFPLSLKMAGIIHKAATKGRDGKGCVILFAAGNQNRPLEGEKDGQPSHQGFALHPDVIAVAASNSLDRRSSYSNFGPEITICASSSGSPGRSIVTTDRLGVSGYSIGDYTLHFGGTSSATPLAAGLVALILSVNPELTASQVKQIMMETADKIDEQNGEYVDGHSPYYGHGRINAHKAVKRAKSYGQDVESGSSDEKKTNVKLEILDVDLGIVRSPSNGMENKLRAETHFSLSGEEASLVASKHLPYQVEVHVEDLNSGAVHFVESEQDELMSDVLEYHNQQELPIPELGRYQLHHSIILKLPVGDVTAKYDGPIINVTP